MPKSKELSACLAAPLSVLRAAPGEWIHGSELGLRLLESEINDYWRTKRAACNKGQYKRAVASAVGRLRVMGYLESHRIDGQHGTQEHRAFSRKHSGPAAVTPANGQAAPPKAPRAPQAVEEPSPVDVVMGAACAIDTACRDLVDALPALQSAILEAERLREELARIILRTEGE